jgi:hypothetical protein
MAGRPDSKRLPLGTADCPSQDLLGHRSSNVVNGHVVREDGDPRLASLCCEQRGELKP